MKSLLKNTYNTRYLLSGDKRFMRSDAPLKISEEEKQWLISQNICTIFDLRSKEEYISRPSAFEGDLRFQLHHIPVTGGATIPSLPQEVSQSYISMIDFTMLKIIDSILHASTSVLYFCSAGKDRTGVVSALLLLSMGISHEEIINDYMQSKEYLQEALEEYAQKTKVSIDIITPKPEYMKNFLENPKVENIIKKINEF